MWEGDNNNIDRNKTYTKDGHTVKDEVTAYIALAGTIILCLFALVAGGTL